MSNRHYEYNRKYFEKINTPNKAYFLGFILGDGYLRHNFVRIAIQERDVEVLFSLISDIKGDISQIKLRKKIPPRQNLVDLKITSVEIVEDLVKNGILLKNKSFEQEWIDVFPKYIPDFIRGLLDSDGSISIMKSKYNTLRCEINFNGTKLMCQGFKENFEKYILEKKTETKVQKGHGEVYVWKYTTERIENVTKIKKNLYPSGKICFLKRKKEKFDEFIEKVQKGAPNLISLSDYPKEICFFQVIPGCKKRCGFCYNHNFIKSYQFDPESVMQDIEKELMNVTAVLFSGGDPLGLNFPSVLFFVKNIRKMDSKIKIGLQISTFCKYSRKKIKKISPDFISFTVNSSLKQDITFFNNQKKDGWETKLIYIPGKIENFSKHQIDVVQQFQPGECLDPEYDKISQPTRDEVVKFARSIGATEIITKENGREKI